MPATLEPTSPVCLRYKARLARQKRWGALWSRRELAAGFHLVAVQVIMGDGDLGLIGEESGCEE